MNIEFTVKRGVPASDRPGGEANTLVAMVLFKLPGETVGRMLAINEGFIRFEAGGDPKREDEVIRRELNGVLMQMTAGTGITV